MIHNKTGRGYLVRKKASCFISSFFGIEIKNLMPILAHRFDQTKHPHYKTSQGALLSLVIW
jgi:hypothetical protein